MLSTTEDIIWNIATFLDFRELVRYSIINSTWYKVCTSNSIWKLVCANLNLKSPSPESESSSIKEWFRRETVLCIKDIEIKKKIQICSFFSVGELKRKLYGTDKVKLFIGFTPMEDKTKIRDCTNKKWYLLFGTADSKSFDCWLAYYYYKICEDKSMKFVINA